MILCHCAAVTDATIARLIDEGAKSVAEITRRCGAGRCCVSCREEISSMLYSVEPAPHIRRVANAADPRGSGVELR
jgi:bacterioferritin-associated ferredoxin